MEWVETTAKTIDAAREIALDRLGVHADEAEIEIVEEPKSGLFGLMRGEARVRARVKPTQVRPKPERRRRGRSERSSSARPASQDATATPGDGGGTDGGADGSGSSDDGSKGGRSSRRGRGGTGRGRASATAGSDQQQTDQHQQGADMGEHEEQTMSEQDAPGDAEAPATSTDGEQADAAPADRTGDQGRSVRQDDEGSDVTPQEVGEAAVAFMDGLLDAFGAEGSSALRVDGTELDITVSGDGLGLLVGSGGRTLNAIQDLARVAAQRRLGDHETRLRIDVAGYRSKRQTALAKFARDVAEMVRSSGEARSMEPMTSADRKVIHDVLNEETGVSSRSEGEDPNRRIVVVPSSD